MVQAQTGHHKGQLLAFSTQGIEVLESNMVLKHRENINRVGKTIMTTRTQKTNNTGMVRSSGKLITLSGWVVKPMKELMGRIWAPRRKKCTT